MVGLARSVGALALLLAATACNDAAMQGQEEVAVTPGVSLELARERAARIGDLRYSLRFDIPGQELEDIQGRVEIAFDLASNAAPLQLDFRGAPQQILSLRNNGVPVDFEFGNEHIVLPAAVLQAGRNRLEIEFIAGNGSLNRNPEYLHTLFVPDRARTAFPLFDQPDLKARFELTLLVPAGWLAMANAPALSVAQRPEQTEYRFAPSDLISSYLFSFVAGRFEAITREVEGRSMTLFHRETDAARVARNVDAIFALHGESIAWMEQYTGIPYPFQSFDFALILGFPYAGMEHVGAIQYRASLLLLDESPPLTELLKRAQLIAHETAHMWFGNLVTMRWFDDVWTKEVFANFIAEKIVNPAFPGLDHELNFLVNHYPKAYAVDRTGGANPIRQPLVNLNQAGQLYGNIIYDKAPIMMRQLELIIGEDGLRDGLRQYLQDFAYGNATWPELITLLDARTERDLASWSEVWVNTPGRPVFRLAAKGRQLQQADPAGAGHIWPQQFDVLALGAVSTQVDTLVAESSVTSLPPALSNEQTIARLYNADGRGYGLFPVDMASLQAWDRLNGVQRGAALVTAYEQLLEAEPGADIQVQDYAGLLLDIVQREQNPLLLKLALDQLHHVYYSLLDDAARTALTPALESVLWSTTRAQPDSSRAKLLFRYYLALASSPAQVQRLYDIWAGQALVDRLILEEEDQLVLAQTLAIRLPDKASAIITQQLAATTNPDRRRRLEFLAPSVAADPQVRDAFFASLRDERNRQTENWVLEGLGNLHHPSRVHASEKYLLPSLELLEEIQESGDIFFPARWLGASLGNYNSPRAAAVVREFLDSNPNYNPQLRLKILQAADPLFRAVTIRAAQCADGPGPACPEGVVQP